ncbi:MAG: hypothetical protein B7Y96_11090 [Comamonadaceae bacterium 32-67-11]|nr:MAG: hypothetical protein B7Y96_11090 [Comamonadaceae bacterium 32-67-11]
MRADLAGLQDAASRLLDPGLWGTRSFNTSNNNTVSGSATATALTGSFAVQVARLAQTQGTVTSARAADSPIGEAGTLEIRTGTWNGNSFAGGAPVAVAVQAGDTLSTLASRINNTANAGVSAIVVRSGGQEQLLLRGSNTGAAAGFEVRALNAGGAAVTDGTSALGSFNHSLSQRHRLGGHEPHAGCARRPVQHRRHRAQLTHQHRARPGARRHAQPAGHHHRQPARQRSHGCAGERASQQHRGA